MKSILKTAVMGAALAATLSGGLQAAWYEDVTFKGDLRYRYESIEATSDRERHRLRLRFGAYGKVNDSVGYGIRLATGGTTDPVSTNQTLGGDSANKALNLDLAYAEMSMTDSLSLTVGKMKNPYMVPAKGQLIFDGDLTPEGLALKYEAGSFFANTAYSFIDSDRTTANGITTGDSEGLAGFQVGFSNSGLVVGLGYFDFDLSGDNAANAGVYHDYNLVDLGVEYTRKFGDTKVTFFGDYVTNIGTESSLVGENQDSAFSFGVKAGFGKVKLGVEYKDVEANAIPAGAGQTGGFYVADSDFGGGATDVDGFKFSAAYGLMKNTEAALTYFVNEQGVSTATPTDYKRLQADLIFKF